MDLQGIDRFSFSKLSCYHTCPLQYQKNYINREGRGEQNSFGDYGTNAHEILEDYFNGKLATFELEGKFEEMMEGVIENGGVTMLIKNKDKYSKIDLTDSYYRTGLEYFQNFDGMPGIKVLGIEEKFDLLLEHKGKKFILNGFIDLVAEKDGDLIIIDHKSKAKFKSKAEKHQYFRQLVLYAIHAEYKYGKPVKECWFNQFRVGVIEKLKLTDELRKEALDWAVDTIEQIEQEQLWLPKIDMFFCANLCGYRFECPYSDLCEEERCA